VGVVIQPINQGRVATDTEVRDRGRELFLSHADLPETDYIIFIKYVILEKCLSKKLKKKRIITQQYFSFHLINKYNGYIDNIFIGDFKSVFMAYNIKDVFFLDATIETTTSAGRGITLMDVSSYVQSVVRKGQKGTGLAIYKVHWDVYLAGGNSPILPTATGVFRTAVFSDLGLPATAVTSSFDFVSNTLNAGNDLAVSIMDWAGGGTAAGDPAPIIWLEPSENVPYVIVRDTIALCMDVSTAVSTSANVAVRLECAQITLDMATLNQLLRTQTV